MAFSLFSYFFKRVVENMAASFKDRYRRNKETLEWYDALAMAVAVIALVFTFGVRIVKVDGHAMDPTLTNGERHDGRAPDYDDWELNGDILVYYPVLDIALELSSMGIRVDEDALDRQLTEAGCDDRRELPFQKAILNKELPYTIGGGIGQSRICMFFLRKAHIGEVHVSLWPKEITDAAETHGLQLL